MQSDQLETLVVNALEELKGVEILSLDVADISGFTDHMIIATGTSRRHVKSLADNLLRRCREVGVRPLGVEGEEAAEWVLVDLGDAVVHIMSPDTRRFYNLEKLWDLGQRVGDRTRVRSPS